ncbi:unannotated protein [freshwater metagenome]|uniref:Unannotated protein n=1 Tax=freshwater metagenome TaxID=449393 RepID=A0A6J6D3R6_9ZZZZ
MPLPPLPTRSRPWSKNCPKRVKIELYGAERPSSGATFGMSSVPVIGSTSGLSPAAARAAGLVAVWSTMRLLMTRGALSTTMPDVWVYEVGTGASGPGGSKGCAERSSTGLRRGISSSAAPQFSPPGSRLLHVPSTVRSPQGRSSPPVAVSGIWCGASPIKVPHGFVGVAVAACRSAILIWSRMNRRSAELRLKPAPTGAAASGLS